jgi:ADP-heptose:LPS heptosyltransferase
MRAQQETEKLVVFRIGSMGDTVVALPCFHAIRRCFPNTCIILLTNVPVSSKAAPMLQVLGSEGAFVDEVLHYNIGLKNPLEALGLIVKLRRIGARSLVYLRSGPSREMLRRDLAFFRIAGFRDVLCAPQNEDQRVPRVNSYTNEVEREAQRLARCLEPLTHIDLEDQSSWDLCLTSNEEAEGKRLAGMITQPFLAINTGGKNPLNDWGYERWVDLLTGLRDQTSAAGLAILGAQADDSRAASLIKVWGEGAVSFCGGPSPRHSAALLKHARLFIGHDSGPLHLAQCMTTPALGLFGSVNKPKLWHPLGSHVSIIHDMRGIDHISVQHVLDKAVEIWNLS